MKTIDKAILDQFYKWNSGGGGEILRHDFEDSEYYVLISDPDNYIGLYDPEDDFLGELTTEELVELMK
jgi:hypothetical protein